MLLVGAVAAVVAAVGAAVGSVVFLGAAGRCPSWPGRRGSRDGRRGRLDLAPPAVVLLAAGAAGPAVVAAHLRGATGRAARTAPATLAALPVRAGCAAALGPGPDPAQLIDRMNATFIQGSRVLAGMAPRRRSLLPVMGRVWCCSPSWSSRRRRTASGTGPSSGRMRTTRSGRRRRAGPSARRTWVGRSASAPRSCSSPRAFCAPCRATRRVLDEVAAQVEGVRHVEIDAESHLDLVRRLDVRQTPTVFVLDSRGRSSVAPSASRALPTSSLRSARPCDETVVSSSGQFGDARAQRCVPSQSWPGSFGSPGDARLTCAASPPASVDCPDGSARDPVRPLCLNDWELPRPASGARS